LIKKRRKEQRGRGHGHKGVFYGDIAENLYTTKANYVNKGKM